MRNTHSPSLSSRGEGDGQWMSGHAIHKEASAGAERVSGGLWGVCGEGKPF